MCRETIRGYEQNEEEIAMLKAALLEAKLESDRLRAEKKAVLEAGAD